ncbi:hypothetical protein KRZ98_04380 [Sphingobium sp. AS12]|uniref:transcriptional regulator domain-containing protein n=1 Tax=Sphingobium sp. AS12 TaxID=2849495 RepID=UPI001C3121B7|nr:DUF6499 domain-containing protein [Sphingobium sp. AS12]MBV2147523.1 hypothetical protein [Sphingobium sp. AS12]
MQQTGLPDWRDAGAYAPVRAAGRPALAWELLRRDLAYRDAVQIGDGKTDVAGASVWGLHFRD